MKHVRMAVVVGTALATPSTGAEALRPRAGAQAVEIRLDGDTLQARALRPCDRLNLTIKGPGDSWERRTFACDTVGVVAVGDTQSPPPPGAYTWEATLLGPGDRSERAWGTFVMGGPEQPLAEPSSSDRAPTADLFISDPTPQLAFDDTDTGALDWQVRTSADGDQFLVQNSTLATTPFTILSSAPTDSLVLSSSGVAPAVGVGTATPLGNSIHVKGNSIFANLVLDANGPTPVGLMAANGAFPEFSVTNGGRRLLTAHTGAPGRSLQVDSTGNVALFADNTFGTDAASASLHVKRSNGTAKLMVEETSATSTGRNLARFVNNGAATFRFDNTAAGGVSWGFGSRQAGDFFISSLGAPAVQMSLNAAGNLAITGTLSQGSDRNTKDDIQPLDPQGVLEKLAGLPLASWRYKGDTAVHAGPMAQDFHQAFGLGDDDRHIAPGDMAGLGLAAIQALVRQNDDLRAELGRLRERVAQLEGGAAQAGDGTRR